MPSKKELILVRIEEVMKSIVAGNHPPLEPTYTYENTVGFVDRQYVNPTIDEIIAKDRPWILVNNEGEEIKPFPTKHFESTILLQLIGFVKLQSDTDRLDTLMNSLQRDIFVAMLSDVSLGGLCTYLIPRSVYVVQELISPHGGFVLNLDVKYNFKNVNL